LDFNEHLKKKLAPLVTDYNSNNRN